MFFFYKHNFYKHTEPRFGQKNKHNAQIVKHNAEPQIQELPAAGGNFLNC